LRHPRLVRVIVVEDVDKESKIEEWRGKNAASDDSGGESGIVGLREDEAEVQFEFATLDVGVSNQL
jgi:hypothetical protein